MNRAPSGGGTAHRRRLPAVLTLVGIAVILAWPFGAVAVAADSAFTVSLDSPAGGTLTDSAAVTVSGHVAVGLGGVLESVRAQVVRDSDGAIVEQATLCCATPQSSAVAFGPWTSSALSRNGAYHVTVTAKGRWELLAQLGPSPDAQATGSFKVAVPPAAPANVKATVLGDRSVQVTWSAAPAYPDFAGYAVYRKTSSGPLQAVAGWADRSRTSFTDTSLGSFSGPIQYQVASIREGAAAGQDNWLIVLSDGATATVPAPVTTTAPGGGTTTTTPGGGLQQGGAASTDLGSFFSSQPAAIPPLPSSPPVTLPDTGYSDTLPFPAGSAGSATSQPDLVDGRQAGRASSSSGTSDLEPGELSGVNRRALLVPVAAGSVLCVAALHLRWLNRRIAAPGGGKGGGLGGGGLIAGPGGPGDPGDGGLEIVEPGDLTGDLAFRPAAPTAPAGPARPAGPAPSAPPVRPVRPVREPVGSGRPR